MISRASVFNSWGRLKTKLGGPPPIKLKAYRNNTDAVGVYVI